MLSEKTKTKFNVTLTCTRCKDSSWRFKSSLEIISSEVSSFKKSLITANMFIEKSTLSYIQIWMFFALFLSMRQCNTNSYSVYKIFQRNRSLGYDFGVTNLCWANLVLTEGFQRDNKLILGMFQLENRNQIMIKYELICW